MEEQNAIWHETRGKSTETNSTDTSSKTPNLNDAQTITCYLFQRLWRSKALVLVEAKIVDRTCAYTNYYDATGAEVCAATSRGDKPWLLKLEWRRLRGHSF